MSKIRNFPSLAIILLIALFLLAGCTSSRSYTFAVDTGDKIEIGMNTTGGYSLTSKLPIEFSKDDEVLSQGTFGIAEVYNTYSQNVEKDSSVNVIEEKENSSIKYLFYEFDEREYNYIIKINNSDTCFI